MIIHAADVLKVKYVHMIIHAADVLKVYEINIIISPTLTSDTIQYTYVAKFN